MEEKKYEHVFFDLDRTLWDFESNSVEALSEIHKEYLGNGQFFSAEEFIKKYKQINAHYWALYRQDKIEKELLRTIRFSKTLEHFGLGEKKLSEKIADAYVKISPYKPGLVDGTKEVLDYLQDKAYSMHIITNGFDEVQWIKLEQSGLKPYMDQVIISEHVGKRKPHPLVFEQAIQAADAQREHAVMIGDDLEADVVGARNFGMDQVFFNPEEEKHEEEVTFEIKHLLELKTIL